MNLEKIITKLVRAWDKAKKEKRFKEAEEYEKIKRFIQTKR